MSAPPPSPSDWHLTETYKGLITLAVETLKMLALVNGGAAVAILTYLGNLTAHAEQGGSHVNIKPALLWYCGGLLATILAFIFAYMTQLKLYDEGRRRLDGKPYKELHPIGIWTSIGLALVAAVSFGFGCLRAAHVLVH